MSRLFKTNGEWIMVVDNSPPSVFFLTTILEKLGYHVISFQDPHTALLTLDALTPDVVIVDYHMGSMDALIFIAHLRERESGKAKLPLLVMTADLSSTAQDAAITAGALLVLHKPLDPQRVAAGVEAALSN